MQFNKKIRDRNIELSATRMYTMLERKIVYRNILSDLEK